ncbi:MAG: ROK family transcriptional regulator [Bowdeniella nasicola]|nr:ROK family transcriptional regulator [Bowdeniella nasicola]
MSSGDQLRARNTAVCFEALRELGTATASDMREATGLSRPTAQAILRSLVERSLASVTEAAPAAGPGRPGECYAFEPAAKVACIDLTPESLGIALADLTGTSREILRRPMGSASQAAAEAPTLIGEAFAPGSPATEVSSILVSVPGVVDPAGVLIHSNAFPSYAGREVREVFPLPDGADVVVENTVNMAALAESRVGAARGHDNVILAHLQGGMKAGIMTDGRLYRGSRFAAGEGSYLALPSHAARAGMLSRLNLLLDTGLNDHERAAVLGDIAEMIAPMLAVMTTTLDPSLVVLTGPDSRAGAALLEPLRARLAEHFTKVEPPPLVLSELDADGPMIGGLIAAIENLTTRLLEGYCPPAPTPVIERVKEKR